MFPSAGVHPVDQLFSLYQDVCPLEDFVEQFLELSHHMPLNDGMLKVCFWSGLDNPISQLMPMEEASCALTQYTDYSLWLSGSSYTVGDVEGPNPSNLASPEPPQSTSILPKPLGSSPPRDSKIFPRPLSHSVLHFKHSVDTGQIVK